MDRLTAPEPQIGEVFPIFQMIELDNGLLLFSHGEHDGEKVRLNALEFNDGDAPRPAVRVVVESDVRDVVGDIDAAERVLDIDESRRIPAKSVRRRVFSVKSRDDDAAWRVKTFQQQGKSGKRWQMENSVHSITIDR